MRAERDARDEGHALGVIPGAGVRQQDGEPVRGGALGQDQRNRRIGAKGQWIDLGGLRSSVLQETNQRPNDLESLISVEMTAESQGEGQTRTFITFQGLTCRHIEELGQCEAIGTEAEAQDTVTEGAARFRRQRLEETRLFGREQVPFSPARSLVLSEMRSHDSGEQGQQGFVSRSGCCHRCRAEA